MNSSSRMTLSAILAGGALALACGGDSSGPPAPTPKTLVVTAGDGQAFPIGLALPTPLTVTVTGTDDRPLQDATVAWTVIAGSATPGASSSVTNTSGVAMTTLTLGSQVGPVAVQASVTGVPPVTFNATAFNPCDSVAAYTLGTTVNGRLVTIDCRIGGFLTDLFSFSVTGQQALTIGMESPDDSVDAYVELRRPNGELLGFHDDIDPGVDRRSRLLAIVAGGDYVIGASNFFPDSGGPYTLLAEAGSVGLAACELVWIVPTISIADSVTAGDCVDTDTTYFDVVGIVAQAGNVLRINLRSTAVDASLQLLHFDEALGQLVLVAANDDSATGITTDAFLEVTAQAGFHFLLAGTAMPKETGAYTLDIAGGSALGARAAAGAPRVPLFAPRAWPKGRILSALTRRSFGR